MNDLLRLIAEAQMANANYHRLKTYDTFIAWAAAYKRAEDEFNRVCLVETGAAKAS